MGSVRKPHDETLLKNGKLIDGETDKASAISGQKDLPPPPSSAKANVVDVEEVNKLLQSVYPELSFVLQIGRVSGHGKIVYMVHDSVLNDYFAVKLIPRPRMENGEKDSEESNVPMEVRLMKRMRNVPHTVPMLDCKVVTDDEDDVNIYLIKMPLLCTLDQYLRSEGFSEWTAAELGIDIGEALAAMHERGIAHMDVKPDNIYVDREGHYLLGDFGSAQEVGSVSHLEMTGTPSYAAPEILAGEYIKNDIHSAVFADQYSLGMVLFELVFSRHFHRHIPTISLEPSEFDWKKWEYDTIHSMPRAVLDYNNSTLAPLIQRMMDPVPESRFPDMAAVKEELLMLKNRLPAPPDDQKVPGYAMVYKDEESIPFFPDES